MSSRLCSRRAREGCAMRCGGRTQNCCSAWAAAHSSVTHTRRADPPSGQIQAKIQQWCGWLNLDIACRVAACFPLVRAVRDHFVVVRRHDVAAMLRALSAAITTHRHHQLRTPMPPICRYNIARPSLSSPRAILAIRLLILPFAPLPLLPPRPSA